jgi:hypothetical protein
MQNQSRLDDLLARDVVPQWFEGVAIVQSVCRQLQAEGRQSDFPLAEKILIAPGGSITTAGGSDGRPVQAAAHVLGLMLGNDIPVRLRLAVSQATATDGGFVSLLEFSEALAYFERPNPESIIEAFRQRALMARPRETAPSLRVDAAPAVEKQTGLTPPPARRRVGRLPVAVGTLSVFAGTLMWAIGHRLPDLLTPKMSTAESSTLEASTVPPNTKRALASTSTPPHNHVDAVQTAPRVPPPESAARSTVGALPALEVVATTLSYHYPTILPSEPVIEIEPRTPLGVVAVADVKTGALETSDRVYSQADPQVTLPLSVYPKFPHDSRAASPSAGTTLELTIAANGLVERVRMLTTPRNIHEFMLLSAAKAWRFEPARIDGRPVRFRQLLTLTAIP